MHLAVEDQLPKRVFIVRNGMLITDNLQHFGDRLVRFPMYKDFIALLEPIDDKSSELIKRLEDPKHKDLSAERLLDAVERKKVKSAIKDLIKWIRECIKNETFEEPSDEIELSELSEFFSDAPEDESIPDPEQEETNPERFTYNLAPKKRKGTSKDGAGTSGGGGTGRGKKKSKQPDGSGRGKGQGGKGSHGRGQRVDYTAFRNTLFPENPAHARIIHFTPSRSARARISIEAAGVNNNETLALKTLNGRSALEPGSCVLELSEDDRITANIELSEPFSGPIELVLIEDTSEESASEN